MEAKSKRARRTAAEWQRVIAEQKRSDLIHVFDYRCTGHDDKGEIPQGFEIVLPRATSTGEGAE